MRRRFLKRKKRNFVIGLLLVSLLSLPAYRILEKEKSVFLEDMKLLLEERLSRSLGLTVHFGGFRATLFHGMVFEKVVFQVPNGRPLFQIEKVKIRKNRSALVANIAGGEIFWRGIYLHHLKGRIFLTPDRFERLGPSALLEKVILDGIMGDGHRVKFSLERRNPLVFEGSSVFRDLPWGRWRFSGTASTLFLIRDRARPWQDVKVKLKTRHLFVNEEPLGNVAGNFSWSGRKLLIDYFNWENALFLSGTVWLSHPYPTESKLRFHLDVNHLHRILRTLDSKELPRRTEGEIFLSGPIGKVHLRGHVVAEEGKIKEMAYQRLASSFHGNWPIVPVESRIERSFPEGSYVAVRGLVDMNLLGKKGFYKNMTLEGADAVTWSGLSLQAPGDETLVLGKSNKTTSVSLKTFLDKGFSNEDNQGEFELEYKLRKQKSLKLRMKGEEEFLGLENKLSF